MNKVSLHYQVTEYDCGCAAVINALSFLFPVSEIPLYFLKVIFSVCLDDFDLGGLFGKGGTSCASMKYLAEWFNQYSKKFGFPLHCFCFEDEDVSFVRHDKLLKFLRDNNAAIVLRCMLYDEHYVTLTGADDNFLYIFDPYQWDIDYGDSRIVRISDSYSVNRKIPIDFLETSKGQYYSLHGVQNKIAIIFVKQKFLIDG